MEIKKVQRKSITKEPKQGSRVKSEEMGRGGATVIGSFWKTSFRRRYRNVTSMVGRVRLGNDPSRRVSWLHWTIGNIGEKSNKKMQSAYWLDVWVKRRLSGREMLSKETEALVVSGRVSALTCSPTSLRSLPLPA